MINSGVCAVLIRDALSVTILVIRARRNKKANTNLHGYMANFQFYTYCIGVNVPC